jgi:hypothetical protein
MWPPREPQLPNDWRTAPIVADKKTDYNGDYGFPEDEEYLTTNVARSNATNVARSNDDPGARALHEVQTLTREKIENERAAILL